MIKGEKMKFYLINYNAENPQKYASAYNCEKSFWKDENLFAGEYKSKHELPIPYYFIQLFFQVMNC